MLKKYQSELSRIPALKTLQSYSFVTNKKLNQCVLSKWNKQIKHVSNE